MTKNKAVNALMMTGLTTGDGTQNGITILSKSAGPVGPQGINFEGPHAILRVIGYIALFRPLQIV